ncbi:MAG TPA: M23 family metallopeptidase [Bacteroidales bacterium]|nr:M23 family metallopeptidase [Bacteroidales bacterium]
MARHKYKFNPDSLSFDRIRLRFRDILLRGLAYIVGSLLIAITYWVILAAFIDSPKEKALKREIQQLTMQYEMMNREMDNVDKILGHLKETDDNLYRTIFEAEPIPASLRDGGIGGINRYKELEGFDNSKVVVETARRLDGIRKKLYIQSKSFDDLISMARNKEEMLSCLPAIQPISNKDLTRTASGWGWRVHPIYKIVKFHYGIDFTAPQNTDIYATGDGVIESIVSSKRGYGNHIIINHGFGYKTLYAHLDHFNVRVGQKVKRGEVIGFVGSTGASLAPHLHYEVEINGEKVDPINFFFNDLTASGYEKIVELASRTGQSFD